MHISDRNLIKEIIENRNSFLELHQSAGAFNDFEHPLDDYIIKDLENFQDNDDYNIYKHGIKIRDIWIKLVDKSIRCLRFFDPREPYLKNKEKQPRSYGLENLVKYFDSYTEFEKILYGSNKHYRDHVIHSYRTWLLGVYLLIKSKSCLIKNIEIDNIPKPKEGKESGRLDQDSFHFNCYEFLSIWTLSALCHDLGYPLEKAHEIVDKTKGMMENFVAYPKFLIDISFTGVQDYINNYILKLISSKMVESFEKPNFYKGRVQPKYYIKFCKSLEHFQHGIISSIIIYKMLMYFMESDYNVNEDYLFDSKDAKQFYIRREILRSMASHTCSDIYHLYSNRIPLLLKICDDMQDWDRKSFADFYKGKRNRIEVNCIDYSSENIEFEVEIVNLDESDLTSTCNYIYSTYQEYLTIFREGIDTSNRNFDFKRIYHLNLNGHKVKITFSIPKTGKSEIKIDFAKDALEKYLENFEKLFKLTKLESTELNIYEITDIKKE